MDQRSEPRFSVDGPVKVTVLTEPETTLTGRIENLSGKGMRLVLDAAIPVGAPIRVDLDGTLLLGEACYCRQEGDRCAAGVQLEHTLTLSEDLARLMRQLLAESSGSNPANPTAERAHGRLAEPSGS